MNNQDFEKSANRISKDMSRWSENGAASFGFITDGTGEYRIFTGGKLRAMEDGIAISIAHLCKMTGEDEIIDDIGMLARAYIREFKHGRTQ